MVESQKVQERISAHHSVIAVIAEGLLDYELMLEEHWRTPIEKMTTFDHKRIKHIKLTMEILSENRDWNEGMIDVLEEKLKFALDKETKGW